MLVDAEQDPKSVRKSQVITDLNAYDARPGTHSSGLKKDELATFGVILKYCTNVQHM